ncbi:MAG: hypothetical protein R2863_08125 [Candidatus Kapaibacterium sp.]|nr:hypothetical protein [Ignavibacteriota bacterium]MCB9220461.1 hypothetical protein [Ignavibacteria bacterium]
MKLISFIFISLLICGNLVSQNITEYNTKLGNFNPEGFEKIGDYYYAGIQVVSDAVIYKLNSNFELIWTDTIDNYTNSEGYLIDDWNYTDFKFEQTDNGVEAIVITCPGKFNTTSWYVRRLNYNLDGVKLSDSLCYCEENWYSGNAVKFRRKERDDYYLTWSKKLNPQFTDHNAVARLNSFGERQWVILLDTNTLPMMHKLDDATVDDNGDLWIVGKMNYDGGGNTPPYLAHLSKDGVELGRYGTNSDKKFGGFKVSVVNNNPVVIASWRDENENYKFGYKNKILIFKLDNNQIIETDYLYEEKDFNYVLTSLSTKDGGMIFSIGSSNFEKITSQIDYSSQDVIFVKFDKNLQLEWELKFGTDGEHERFNQSFEEEDGIFTFVGKVGDRMTVVKVDNTKSSVVLSEIPIEYQTVDVYNLNGVLVIGNIEKNKLDQSSLTSGTYLLKHKDLNGLYKNTEKIVIAK